ncbi:unnamed protein product [Phyllotreta striolata]|uniref:Odorant receptor n=1 Tax=Phyllotreta striolata TaxID=444603 RepID=A0A9N9XP07_PHYSR|nr:unnamed protein product [Phyllotreta striolata]
MPIKNAKPLESALIIPKLILIFAGRWPQHSSTLFTRVRVVTFNSMEILFNILMMVEVYLICTSDFNFNMLFDIMGALITASGHLFKIWLFSAHRKIWLDILQQLKSTHFNDYPEEFHLIGRKPVNFSKNFGNMFQLGCCFSSTAYILAPLFSNIDLPIKCSFVTKAMIPYAYPIQSFVVCFCALTHSSVDVMITDLIGVAVGQLDLLGEKIKAVRTNLIKQKIDLGECVRHHVEIIRFVANLNDAGSGIIMVEYVKSALVVCFLGIQAVSIDPTSAPFMRIVVYGFVMLFQLNIYCFFANEILVKSKKLGDACYLSTWYENPDVLKYKTNLLIIMERSKRPLYLTAGKWSVVSLQSFATILKSSYSYFTLMQTLYNNNSM